eukprot:CAMPEP_0119260244 /NCGR_PEP_ID=MMETSP1329-20130426/726_1 /TAXON_ID=114041 /ORGANISM="Genus nov. species nov., Strain RCC1024" /LENGTH=376 /DNA_ID=CAMNT_0007259665 /DNA_START=253 /DNA_END=1380 /DNA_ORIENTATION=+
MVEGHSVHRVASRHRAKLVGKTFKCTSPNGRFADGAAMIDGKKFTSIEAVGKNLFAWFGAGADEVCVHVHFGMAGVWAVFEDEEVPETTKTTRLCMTAGGITSHLSAMTVQEMDRAGYDAKRAKLGEDPLRDDCDPERLWGKVSASKKSIGALIMDQSYFTGPGNIYRAEILFKAGIHPDRPGNELSRAEFDEVWRHTVELLRRGYETGSILTVDAEDTAKYGDIRRYIYNKASCPKCQTRIQTWDIGTRTAYACPRCQPERAPAAPATPAKGKKKRPAPGAKKPSAAKRAHTPFISHCVVDAPADKLASPSKLTVKELRAELAARGADTSGLKAALVQRFESLAAVRSAEDAAAEKARAGENRAVEHVAELAPSQ